MTSNISHNLKRLAAGLCALLVVAGAVPGNIKGGELFGEIGTGITAYADSSETSDPVPYMTWDDAKKKPVEMKDDNACKEYIVVTAETTAIGDGKWYVVNADTTVADRITVSGTANLILADGKTLTSGSGIEVSEGNTLNIYAQSEGDTAGTLIANGVGDSAGIGGGDTGCGATVIINGGTVSAAGNTTEDFTSMGIGAGAEVSDNGSLTVADGLAVYGGESEDPTDIQTDYAAKRWKYMIVKEGVAHTHDFTHNADGATITATCNGTDGCDITEGLEMTISAPTALTYDGKPKPATLNNGYSTTAFPGDVPTIVYYKEHSPMKGVPTDAGDYTAEVTYGEATAFVDFTLKQKALTVTAPNANDLTYNAEDRQLVTAGKTDGGKLVYALGDNAADVPESGWSTEIPAGKQDGTYYVWYKVEGDDNFKGTEPACIEVTIKKSKQQKTDEAKTVKVTLTDVWSDEYGTLSAAWTSDAESDGYEVLIWNSRRMGGRTAVSKFDAGADTEIKIDGLMPNDRCYVKVRAYRIVDGKKVCGKYSRTGSAAVKGSDRGFGFTSFPGYGHGFAPYTTWSYGYGHGYGYGFNPFVETWNGYNYGINYGRPYLSQSNYSPYFFYWF